ncbi:beta-fructofuranosidase, insoluble isoenzyme 6-like [Bidens hawaiensis]|uniref:beta-fructofuranosidase, insoluble isoenzyme 6-like n=1 Tax=Bidens hawaiensis TaxID=980011 RepID=UPI00404A0C68
MLYTGIDSKDRQVQNLVVPKNLSDPYLREWVKYKGNPVINLPDGTKRDDFRDPTTGWRARNGIWRTLVASVKNNTGVAFLYRSADFVIWSYFTNLLEAEKLALLGLTRNIFAVKGMHQRMGNSGLLDCSFWHPVT